MRWTKTVPRGKGSVNEVVGRLEFKADIRADALFLAHLAECFETGDWTRFWARLQRRVKQDQKRPTP